MKRNKNITILICVMLFMGFLFPVSQTVGGSKMDVGDHIVINEVCENTSSGAQWIELYNPTDHEFRINPRPLSSNPTDYWIISFKEDSPPHILLPEFTIYPGEYVVLAPYNNTREYWQIPENVKVIENLNFHHMWGTIWYSVRIGNESNYDIFGESIEESVVPQIAFNHSWARYKGGYDTDNFTNDFYDEPNPTPGYENHRVKDDNPPSPAGWPETSLILTMSATVLASVGVLIVMFRRIGRGG